MRMYTLNEISNLLTKASPTKVYTMQRIWGWCQKEGLQYESIPYRVRGVSYKPIWIREDSLRAFIEMKGFNIEGIFPN